MAQSITDLRVGTVVNFNGEPCKVVQNSFMRTAQRKPVMRTKLKGVMTGKVFEKTFIAGEDFEIVQIEKVRAQYMYKDDEAAHFMDSVTFDQFSIQLEMIEEAIKFLKEGEDTVVTRYEGKPIGIELPPKVVLKIVETTPGVRGDTATGGTKAATLETGMVVHIPLFLEEGDAVRINTETGEYVERAQ